MSAKHPIISVTGSSGAGTTSVRQTFENIFRREHINAAFIEGDAFHRYDRAGMRTAMEEAIYLSKLATKVTVIHRRDTLRASKVMQDKALSTPNIAFLWNKEVVDIKDIDQGKVTALVLRDTNTGEKSELAVDGVFIGIGHTPNTALFRGQLAMHENGYLKTHDGTRTSVAGVFAAGDVQDHVYRQAVTAAGSGCMAAIDAERFLSGTLHESSHETVEARL